MKHDKTKCLLCNQYAAELHEIYFGRGVRQISIDHGYQVPLCRYHHEFAHRQKDEAQSIIFERLGLDTDTWIRCRRIFNCNTKDWTIEDEEYIEKIGHYIQDKLE